MAGNNAPEVYRGRRKRLNVLGIVLGVLVALILLTVVLFFGLQKYIVFGHDGISVVLPGAGASADGVPGGEEAPMQVGATLSISDPDYSSLAATAGEDLRDIVAVFVPAADVNTQGVSRYMSVMDYYSGANALVLEVKPASGQLVWSSSSPTAAGYGLSGSVDLAALIAAIRQQSPDIYLVAQISCFVDSLLAERSSGSVLRLAGGGSYVDEHGAWLDPYSTVVADYLTELCTELIDLGFDELLLENFSLPPTDQEITFNVQLSSAATRETAVCGMALEITGELSGYNVPISVMLNADGFHNGKVTQTGQNLSVFGKLFDRLCCTTDSAWRSGVDRDSLEQYLVLGNAAQRYVPVTNYIFDGFPCAIVQVPSELLPQNDSQNQ